MTLRLTRRLGLLTLLPLSAALIFVLVKLYELRVASIKLDDLRPIVGVARQLVGYKAALDAERVASDQLGSDARTVDVYRSAIRNTEEAYARVQESMKTVPLDPSVDWSEPLREKDDALRQHREQRIVSSGTLPGSAYRRNLPYIEVQEFVSFALHSLAAGIEERDVRYRLQVLAYYLDICTYAESERLYYIDAHRRGQLNPFELIQAERSRWLRGNMETQLRRSYPHDYVHEALAAIDDPASVKAGQLVEKLRQPPSQPPFNRAVAMRTFDESTREAWETLSNARAVVLSGALEAVAAAPSHYVQQTQAGLTRQWVVNAFLSVGFVIVTLGVTRWQARRLERVLTALADRLSGGVQRLQPTVQAGSEAGQKLAESASKEAASLEETAAALEELTSINAQNAKTAQQAAIACGDTVARVTTSAEPIQHLVSAMEEIAQTSTQTQTIVLTIDEIAFQTNLLALNASIEAARAGDSGAGFAVVAEEVRRLAQRATESAAATAKLIDTARTAIDGGATLTRSVAHTFQVIRERVERSMQRMQSVHSGTERMLEGIQRVNTATHELDRATQQNAAIAQENAAAASEVAGQLLTLHEAIEDLRTLIAGARRIQTRPDAISGSSLTRSGPGRLSHGPGEVAGRHEFAPSRVSPPKHVAVPLPSPS